MPQLISKLQFKTCEKGEFFDEQPRSLEDTLQLIKDFPWDAQRGTDVQLSGPGIVIAGDKGDYLKVALYFGGKFSAYYLDTENHLYECHTADLNDEFEKVKDFFAGDLNLNGFDKHFFNIGNRAHLITNNFEYPSRKLPLIVMSVIGGIYLIAITFALTATSNKVPVIGLTVFFAFFSLIIYGINFSGRKKYLKISKGHDEFLFGDSRKNAASYNKNDIAEVLIYTSRGQYNNYTLAYIIFKNNSKLKFSPQLIPTKTLMSKFDEKLIRIEIVYTGFFTRWLN